MISFVLATVSKTGLLSAAHFWLIYVVDFLP